MNLISINIGQPGRVKSRGRSVLSGIRKKPTSNPVRVFKHGIKGDCVLNTKHHGGPDQAVYGYRVEDYNWWTKELSQSVNQGMFGENLTLEGLASHSLPIGSRLHFTKVVLEVSAPRIPCQTLNAVVQSKVFAQRFVKEARSGFYFRVINEGELATGEIFELELSDDAAPLTSDLFHANYRGLSKSELEHFLVWPLDIRTKRKFQRQLKRCTKK